MQKGFLKESKRAKMISCSFFCVALCLFMMLFRKSSCATILTSSMASTRSQGLYRAFVGYFSENRGRLVSSKHRTICLKDGVADEVNSNPLR